MLRYKNYLVGMTGDKVAYSLEYASHGGDIAFLITDALQIAPVKGDHDRCTPLRESNQSRLAVVRMHHIVSPDPSAEKPHYCIQIAQRVFLASKRKNGNPEARPP
jgi:hypothetical protein